MRVETVTSYPASIFIAGDPERATAIIQGFCDRVGLCVTVTHTTYVYTDGQEVGVIVGLINYPRFPKAPSAILDDAQALAKLLRTELRQESYTIQTPEETRWYSWRPADLAIADTHPKDGDVKQAPLVSGGGADRQSPNPLISHPGTSNE